MFYASSMAVSPDGKTLASGHADTTILLWNLLPQVRTIAKVLTTAELDQAWSLIADIEAKPAYAAMSDLAAAPAQAVAFLQGRLKPTAVAPAEKIQQLIIDLDSANGAKREVAQRSLLELGELAVPALHDVLKQTPTLEQRRRVQQILSTPAGKISPDALRSLRAIQVLEPHWYARFSTTASNSGGWGARG